MSRLLGENRRPPPCECRDADNGRRFDVDALARYLAGRGVDHGELSVQPFLHGNSRRTFLVKSGHGPNATRFVLRKSAGLQTPVPPHGLAREYRVMEALAGIPAVPVPAVHGLCTDDSVLGASFYIRDYIVGRTLADASLASLPRGQRSAVYFGMIDTLAALHNIDVAAVGLSGLGRSRGDLALRITAWRRQYEQTVSDPEPAMCILADWLVQNLPMDATPVITHGDYRLANLILADDSAELVAVLDWELTMLGHPLADLAYACLPYYLAEDMEVLPGISGLDLTARGIPDESELLQRYCSARGLAPIRDWPAFIAFALFGIAACAHTVEARSPGGRHGDRTMRVARQVGELAELGWQMARYHDMPG